MQSSLTNPVVTSRGEARVRKIFETCPNLAYSDMFLLGFISFQTQFQENILLYGPKNMVTAIHNHQTYNLLVQKSDKLTNGTHTHTEVLS